MHLPTQRQQTVARLSFEESAAHFYLRNDWQKTNFRLCQRGELWSTRWDAKCQRHKPSRGEEMWPVCNRETEQDEKDPNNPGAGGGFTFSSALLSPLRWGVAAPVFGWHVSIVCAMYYVRVTCYTCIWHVCQVHVSQQARAVAAGCHPCPECRARETLLQGEWWLLWDHGEILRSPRQWPADLWPCTFLLPCCWLHSPRFVLRR